MKHIISIIALIVLSCGFNTLAAKNGRSDRLKPKWLTSALPESKSGSYSFISASGQASSMQGAKFDAFVSMSRKLEIERALTINTSVQQRELIAQSSSSTSGVNQEIVLDVTENGQPLKISCREIDDYWVKRNGIYELHVLYAVSDNSANKSSYDDKIQVTSKYPRASFLSLIPSVGQYYKGDIVKGSVILVGQVATLGGVLLCEETRASYIKKMKEQPRFAAEYNSLANKWETGRNMCIGAAAAVYIYNLIDAFTANGAKRVIVKKQRHVDFSMSPYTNDYSCGVNMSLTF